MRVASSCWRIVRTHAMGTKMAVKASRARSERWNGWEPQVEGCSDKKRQEGAGCEEGAGWKFYFHLHGAWMVFRDANIGALGTRPRKLYHRRIKIRWSAPITGTSQLRRLVLCILHTIIFAKEKNENTGKNDESSLADICDVTSRDYVALFP